LGTLYLDRQGNRKPVLGLRAGQKSLKKHFAGFFSRSDPPNRPALVNLVKKFNRQIFGLNTPGCIRLTGNILTGQKPETAMH
jgi:hypothetical protein